MTTWTCLGGGLAALALAAAAGAAEPTSDRPACWAASVAEPVSGEDLPIGHAAHRPLLVAMDRIEAMVRPNPGLRALPEVRLRFGREVHGAVDPQRMPREAVLHALGFGPKAWGRGDCELIAQASRLGPRAGISFFINKPTATLNRWEHDEQLVTWLAQPESPSFQGWPTYGECALISAGRRLPWVPVTVEEMLGLYERTRQRELADWDQRHARAFEPFDLAAAEREAAALRAHSAPAADAMLAGARQRKALEPAALAALRREREALVDDLADLRAMLAAMTPAERAAPYRVGTGRHRLPKPGERLDASHAVVKLDPGFPWDGRRRSRIQLLTVCAPQLERHPRYHAPMRTAIEALDFTQLSALVE